VIAAFTRGLGFTWLALLVVIAEFQIVISRFVFSYEQVFMGDLVRFWYAALFLFASAHALIDDGHVRVDVLYAHFSKRGKAWTNGLGSLLLGIPLCWVILTQGMWTKGSSLNSPLISFEISQSGYGMYTKYMMAGFLVVFALSMTIQFASYFLEAVADLRRDPGHRETHDDDGLTLHR
jgi:TRAP-type mannitol/chloroaromatic compound transport system permease small subunit